MAKAQVSPAGGVYPAAEMHQGGVVNRLLPAARDHGVAAADAVTVRETGQVFATRDLPAGLESLLERGPNQAIFEGR
jgi:hypothetical protein